MLSHKFKFSVVMAIYNTEDFLNEAIDSVINQTIGFENVELILVDDGSQDNSKNICLDYKNRFPDNIQYIHQENQGQAVARNNGMKIASGKYLNFLDSDDKLELNALELVYEFFKQNDKEVDVASIPIKFFDRQSGNHILNYKYESTKLVDLNENPDYIQLSASSSFIKKEAVKDYIFDPNLVVSEDAIFINKILLEKRKLGVVCGTAYYYRKRISRDSSVDIYSKSKDYFIQRSENFFNEIFSYSKEKYGEIFEFIKYTVAYDLQWIFDARNIEEILDKDELKTLKSYLSQLLKEIDDEIILNQRHSNYNLKYHILIFKHTNIETEVFEKENNVKKIVNQHVIDELYYHKFYLDAVEIHKSKLTFLGYLKSYFIYPEIKIQAVKCDKTSFLIEWFEFVNKIKPAFFKNEYLNDDGKEFKSSLLNNNEISPSDCNLNGYIDHNELTNEIISKISPETMEKEFLTKEYVDRKTYLNLKNKFLTEFLNKNGEIYDSKKIEYPLRDRKYLDSNHIPRYNFEINMNLNKTDNSIVKIRVAYGSLKFYLQIRMENYSRITAESFYSKKENYLIKYENDSFNIHNYSLTDLMNLEDENIKYFEAKNKDSELDEVIRFRKLYYYSFFSYAKRRIWLFMDRLDVGDDNAEHLFKYAVKQNDGIEKYFVLSEDSRDFERLSKIGNVVKAGTDEHKLLACHAEKIISSQADEVIINPFNKNKKFYNGLFSAKVYFLQHGVIKEDISSWLHRYDKYLYLLLTSAKAEYDSILNPKTQYNYGEYVQLLGLPRHDYREKLEDKKEIVIMPSWRRSLENMIDEQFKNSEFYRVYNALLNDEKLIEYLNRKSYKLIFKPHHNLNEYLDLFDKNCDVEFDYIDSDHENKNAHTYNDIFNHSSLIITDYSSVAFDFAYIKKPVIYYHAVEDYHFSTEEGYFDYNTMGFGEIVKEHGKLVDLIIEYVKSDCKMKDKYSQRVDNFFEFNDKNNCRRVYEFISNN